MTSPPAVARAASLPVEEQATQEAAEAAPEKAWRTVVWDDPVNLMSYVTYVFRTYFGYDEPRAHRLMMQVHTEGRAVVSHGHREQMEVDVQAMHSYGLWATLEEDA